MPLGGHRPPLQLHLSGSLPDQAKGVSQIEHRPGGRENDQREKKKFDDNTGSVALRVALAHEAKRAQAHRKFRIKQLTISTIAA